MFSSQNPSDLDLLRRYSQSRDPEAFAELTRRHARMVYSVALRVTGRPHDAEDVAQACFLELARHADDIRTSVAGWLHSLATSRASNSVRDRATRSRHERQAAEVAGSEESELSWVQLAPLIDRAINSLPEEVRLPLVLHYLHGQGQQEIARTLNLSQPTVSRRLSAGVEQLRAALRSQGVVASTAALSGLLAQRLADGAAAAAVPATLQASLGKLAVAGIGPAKTIGAGSLLAKAGVAAIVLGLGVVSWLVFLTDRRSQLARDIAATPTAAAVTKAAGKYSIQGVPPLRWGAGKSGQTTVLGAMAVAMRAAGTDVDYTQLLGDSGVAFRLRWMNIESANQHDPFLAVRLAAPPDLGMVARSTGWGLAFVTNFTPGRSDVLPFADAIAASIRAGKAVVAEDPDESAAGIIFAADSSGSRLQIHQYGWDAGGRSADLSDMGGGLMFLVDRRPAISRRDAVIAAMTKAVRDWHRPVDLRGFAVYYGDAGWEAWMQQAVAAQRMSGPHRDQFRHVSCWTYAVFCDARYHAAIYLRRHADLFTGRARAAMLAAAQQYERLEREHLVDPAYRSTEGPWSSSMIERWRIAGPTPPAILARAHAIDTAAMREIERALNAIAME